MSILPQEECDMFCFVNKHQVLLLIITFTAAMVVFVSVLRLLEAVSDYDDQIPPAVDFAEPPQVLCEKCHVKQPIAVKEWLL
ncbi:hypothetical protein QR680_016102 [Steinernema hermaphroditum]|nr:hypothetical protein QR680_016102 [Steinernema hermaphroditum]